MNVMNVVHTDVPSLHQTELCVSLSLCVCLVLQVRASLVWNVIGAVMGLVGVAFTCWLLADHRPSERFCNTEPWGDYQPTQSQIWRCMDEMRLMDVS